MYDHDSLGSSAARHEAQIATEISLNWAMHRSGVRKLAPRYDDQGLQAINLTETREEERRACEHFAQYQVWRTELDRQGDSDFEEVSVFVTDRGENFQVRDTSMQRGRRCNQVLATFAMGDAVRVGQAVARAITPVTEQDDRRSPGVTERAEELAMFRQRCIF